MIINTPAPPVFDNTLILYNGKTLPLFVNRTVGLYSDEGKNVQETATKNIILLDFSFFSRFQMNVSFGSRVLQKLKTEKKLGG